jgi:hypothetical protein
MPVKQKNSQVKRPFPCFFGGTLPGRATPARAVARWGCALPRTAEWDRGAWGGFLDEMGPFLTVLTQFPHHTMFDLREV